MSYNKIHIIGGPGSGKSYLANKLSKKLKIPCYDLDDIKWDNKSDSYGIRAPEHVRDSKLKRILLKDKWIVEGVYLDWVKESFRKAELIIFLDSSEKKRRKRILIRFIKLKFKRHKKKKETFKGLLDLMKWNKVFSQERVPQIKEVLKRYSKKVKIYQEADKAYEGIIN